MNLEFIGLIVLVVIGMTIWIIIGSKKRKWYLVYLANNDVLLLYRDLNERWWRTSDKYLRFKDEFSREVTFLANGHWILMWKEVPTQELEITKTRLELEKAKKAKIDNA